MDAGLDDLDAIDRDAEGMSVCVRLSEQKCTGKLFTLTMPPDAYFSNETASYDGAILEEMEGVEREGRGGNAWPHNRFLRTNSNSLIY
jgi:hypothetical protein